MVTHAMDGARLEDDISPSIFNFMDYSTKLEVGQFAAVKGAHGDCYFVKLKQKKGVGLSFSGDTSLLVSQKRTPQ